MGWLKRTNVPFIRQVPGEYEPNNAAIIRHVIFDKLIFGKTTQSEGCSYYLRPEIPFPANYYRMKYRLAIALIALAALTRLLPHPHNFTPIGAMALFGAAYFNRRWLMLAVPFAALFLSDLFINNVIYRELYGGEFTLITSWWIYAAFALVMLAGSGWLAQKVTAVRVLGASLSASAVFFLVTNFSVWAESAMYPHTVAGLLACYTAGLPFLGNTILGDLFFSAALFGAYEWMLRRAPQLSAENK